MFWVGLGGVGWGWLLDWLVCSFETSHSVPASNNTEANDMSQPIIMIRSIKGLIYVLNLMGFNAIFIIGLYATGMPVCTQ